MSAEKLTIKATNYKIGDWVLCGRQGLALGKTGTKKVRPSSCWRGPFKICKVDTKRQTVTLLDPTDELAVVSPDVHISVTL